MPIETERRAVDFHNVTVAVAKGRILDELLTRWPSLGFEWPLAEDSRQLWFQGSSRTPGVIIVRGPDVAVLVERGVADLGVVGSDLLIERGELDVLEVGDLDMARCRVVLAGKTPAPPQGPFRVATKYRRIAESYLERRHWVADIVPLSGSLELAPLVGLAPYIIDIVDTGRTLREHGLVEIETIHHAGARLIANPAFWRTKEALVTLRDRFDQLAREERKKVTR